MGSEMCIRDRSASHTTLLAFGNVKALSKDNSVSINVVMTTTIMDIDGLPVFFYVYARDTKDKASIERVIALTKKVRLGITSKNVIKNN